MTSLRCISDADLVAVRLSPSVVSVVLRLLAHQELLAVEVRHVLVIYKQGVVLHALRLFLRRLFLFLDGDTAPLPQVLHGFGVVEVVALHDVVDDVSLLPTAIALEGVGLGVHDKRGCTLGMERAASLLPDAVAPEFDRLADDGHDVSVLQDSILRFSCYHL